MNGIGNGLGKQVLIGVLIALFSASVGFSTAIVGVVSKVNQSASDIRNIKDTSKEDRNRGDQNLREERDRADKRMFELVGLMKEQIKLNVEIIELVKIQNQLLARTNK
jgi:Tfp pilus assembly protein PilO